MNEAPPNEQLVFLDVCSTILVPLSRPDVTIPAVRQWQAVQKEEPTVVVDYAQYCHDKRADYEVILCILKHGIDSNSFTTLLARGIRQVYTPWCLCVRVVFRKTMASSSPGCGLEISKGSDVLMLVR